MRKVTINVPDSLVIRNVGGKAVRVDFTRVPESVFSDAFQGGFLVVMNNTFNSGGKDASETERLANLERRINAMYEGHWISKGGGGSSLVPYMWEALWAEKGIADNPAAVAKATKDAAELVRKTLGEKEKATFGNYIRAISTQVAKARKLDAIAVMDKLMGKYESLAEARKAEAEKAAASLDVGADLDAMLDGIEL